jgi:hypothetical protein
MFLITLIPSQKIPQTQRKESSASDQDPVREPDLSSKSSRPSSRSASAADGIFVQPRLHTHRRSRSKDSTGQSPDSELKDQCESSQRGQPKTASFSLSSDLLLSLSLVYEHFLIMLLLLADKAAMITFDMFDSPSADTALTYNL